MILAKSDGTSLQHHIDDCLVIWHEMKKAVPKLPVVSCLPEFWQVLFAAVYIHDFGKAQCEFQKVLQSRANTWCRQRHELYSVPFADKFLLRDHLHCLLKRVVLGHHRDFMQLYREKYKKPNILKFEKEVKWSERDAHPEDYIYNLRTGFNQELVQVIEQFDTVASRYGIDLDFSNTVRFISQPHPYQEIAGKYQDISPTDAEFLQNMLLLGALKLCDHYGSAGVTRLPLLEDGHFAFLEKMRDNLATQNADFYEHQKACARSDQNCLLVAPTGSGKTEAALLWLRRQMAEQGRVFYVLPFTASINAMHQRLCVHMDPGAGDFSDIIGLEHGNVPAYLASVWTEIPHTTIHQRNAQIRNWKQQLSRMQHPLKVVTPFQLLKYFYGVKGFEMGWVQFAGAKLVFDEIHAYEPETFAQIQVMLDYLIRYMDCRVMIMTATLPSFLKRMLAETLKIKEAVIAEKQFLHEYTRHKIVLQEGDILMSLDQVVCEIDAGKRVILCCNTVQRSQEVYQTITEKYGIPENLVTLLHGRFHAQDRRKKEKQLFKDEIRLLIGTQAIEVSLDIDFDCMFTEPAPLDALLQRFGRVNRKRRHTEPCPVTVFSHGSESDKYIYNMELVQRSLDVLKDVGVLNENAMQQLLDRVYPDWLPKEREKYEQTKIAFEHSLISLQPYSYPKEREQDFYEKFDGIRVLPAGFWKEYKQLIENYDFIGADQLLVSIQKGMYWRLKNENKIELSHLAIFRDENKIEKHAVLVAKCYYDAGLGMTNNRQEMDDDPFL